MAVGFEDGGVLGGCFCGCCGCVGGADGVGFVNDGIWWLSIDMLPFQGYVCLALILLRSICAFKHPLGLRDDDLKYHCPDPNSKNLMLLPLHSINFSESSY